MRKVKKEELFHTFLVTLDGEDIVFDEDALKRAIASIAPKLEEIFTYSDGCEWDDLTSLAEEHMNDETVSLNSDDVHRLATYLMMFLTLGSEQDEPRNMHLVSRVSEYAYFNDQSVWLEETSPKEGGDVSVDSGGGGASGVGAQRGTAKQMR